MRCIRNWNYPLYLSLFSVHSFVAQPSFNVKPQDQKIGLNGVASFECRATGNPPPSVFWAREGSQMLMFPDNSYGHIHVTSQGTLQIRGVQKEDAGYYVCSALSVAGSATIRAFLQVTSVDDIPPPIIQIGPANQTLPIGSVAMLPCRAIGNPAPRIRWYKDGMPLQTNQRLIIVQTGSLKIDSKYRPFTRECFMLVLFEFICNTINFFYLDLQVPDTGHFTCTASSESGETSWSASLSVCIVTFSTMPNSSDWNDNGTIEMMPILSYFYDFPRWRKVAAWLFIGHLTRAHFLRFQEHLA